MWASLAGRRDQMSDQKNGLAIADPGTPLCDSTWRERIPGTDAMR